MMNVKHLDMKTALLCEEIQGIYIEQPSGFENKNNLHASLKDCLWVEASLKSMKRASKSSAYRKDSYKVQQTIACTTYGQTF